MKKIIILFIFIPVINNETNAGCYTGFACSVADLEKQEQIQTRNNINIFKKYLKKIQKPHKFTVLGNSATEYDDLFIFKLSEQNFTIRP